MQGLLITALRLFKMSVVTWAFSLPVQTVTSCCCRGPSALDHLAAKLTVSMMTLADVASATLPEGVTDVAASAGSAVQSATDAAASTITQKDNGWFGFLTGPLETVLKVCLPATGTAEEASNAMSCQHGKRFHMLLSHCWNHGRPPRCASSFCLGYVFDVCHHGDISVGCLEPCVMCVHCCAVPGLRVVKDWRTILLWVCHHPADGPGQGPDVPFVQEAGMLKTHQRSDRLCFTIL